MRVLGPVRLRAGDGWQVPASPQLRLVLGLMTLRIGQVVPGAELVDAIWEDEPPRAARAGGGAGRRLRGGRAPRVGGGQPAGPDDPAAPAAQAAPRCVADPLRR